MENFVLSGRAKTVFRLIELKTQRAKNAEALINLQSFKLRQQNHAYASISEHRQGDPCPLNKAIVRCQVYPCLGRACQPGKERN